MLTSFTVASDRSMRRVQNRILKYGTAYLVHGTTIFPRAHRTRYKCCRRKYLQFHVLRISGRFFFFFFLNKVALKAISPLASQRNETKI